MRIVQAKLPALLIVALLMALTPAAALAAPRPQSDTDGEDVATQAGVRCSEGVCELSLDLDTVSGVPVTALRLASGALRVAERNLQAVPDGTRLQIDDRVTLALPVGEIELFDADLDVERSEEGDIERFYGTAAVPLPTLGILEDVQLVAPGRALVAYDSGEALAHLGTDLDPERRYLALHFGSGSQNALTDPTFSFTGDEGQNSLLLIIDPAERFIYAVGNLMLVDTAELLLTGEVPGVSEGAALTAGLLPLPERFGLRLALLVSEELADTELDLSTGYAVTGGPLAARFGLDVEPIAFEGTFSLDDDGVALVGKARSTLEPDEVFASEGSAAVQIPLLGSDEQAALVIEGGVDVPMFSFSEGGDVTLVVPDVPVAEALTKVRGTVTDSSDAARDGVEWVVMNAASRADDASALGDGVQWAAVSAADRLGATGDAAADVTMEGLRWATDFVGDAVEFAAENADQGASAANDFWCNRLGRCGPDATAASE